MASIVSRGNGKYAVVYYEGKGESRRQIWKSGLTMNEALKLKEKVNAEARKGKVDERLSKLEAPSSEISVEDYMNMFVKSYGLKHWGVSYYANNVSLLNNYITPYLGDYRVVDITTRIIDNYYDFLLTECEPVHSPGKTRRERVSAAQVKCIHKFLKTAFTQAKRWKMVSDNPICDADPPSHKAVERPAFSPEEFEKILAYTDKPDEYEKYVLHVALCIQYYCTTRGGEVSALQWSDYDSENETLHICKTIARVKREYLHLPKLKVYYTFPDMTVNATTAIILKSPKTESTERLSKINSLLIMKLDRLKELQKDMMVNIFDKYYFDHQLIICQPNGRPLMPEQLNRKFKGVIREMQGAGFKFSSVSLNRINDVVFHSVRAASATKKLSVSGGNIKAVMTAGGWAEPDMVIRYSKDYTNDQKNIVQQMERDYLKVNDTPEYHKLQEFITDHSELITEIIKGFLDGAFTKKY